jgi:integrase
MNDAVGAILRALPSRFRGSYVFPSRTGDTPLNGRNLCNRVFNPALKRAGIENFRWHDLRHTFASRLAMQGEDLLTIKDLLGHKTMDMTLRYAHLSPGHHRDAVQRLARNRTGTNTGTVETTEKSASESDR